MADESRADPSRPTRVSRGVVVPGPGADKGGSMTISRTVSGSRPPPRKNLKGKKTQALKEATEADDRIHT